MAETDIQESGFPAISSLVLFTGNSERGLGWGSAEMIDSAAYTLN